MAKTSSKKRNSSKPDETGEPTTSNAAYAKKNNPSPAFSTLNTSKYASTNEVNSDVQALEATDGLRALFYDGLKGMYWSEMHLTDALPKMAAAAGSKALKKAIQNHLAETEMQVQRLEEIFEMIGRTAKAKKCAAMEGLSIDGEAIIENTDTASPARDLGIIMASNKVEHYEIAAYSGLIKLAANLGFADAASLLELSLQEEQASADLLNDISDKDAQLKTTFKDNNEAR